MRTAASTSSAHSPPLWFYDQVTRGVCDADGTLVATIEPRERPEDASEPTTRANGLLVAAAPDLLDACNLCLEDARMALRGEWEPAREGFQAQVAMLRRAIRKSRRPS